MESSEKRFPSLFWNYARVVYFIVLFVVSNYFCDHLVWQADDHLSVVGDVALMDTDFIWTGRVGTGYLAVFHGDGVGAA